MNCRLVCCKIRMPITIVPNTIALDSFCEYKCHETKQNIFCECMWKVFFLSARFCILHIIFECCQCA